MSSGSSQRRVRQRTKEGIAATRARVENRQAIPEKSVVRADIMVAHLDIIYEIIQANPWGYLYTCACQVYPRLVRDFYGHLEVVQDDDNGIILQTTDQRHIIKIDPQLIKNIIGVPALDISASLFSDILEPPSLEQLRDFFHAHPEGNKRTHAYIKIGAFSPPHRLLSKIVLHNLWPTVRRSELVLKRAQFLYALVMRMPFCLCKHIINTMLEMRDDHATTLPFVCLVMKISLQFVIDISTESIQ